MNSSSSTHLNSETGLIYDEKLSSVVPASITAEDKRGHELTNIDLIMKLHHITTVHFFESDVANGLGIDELKKPMFKWLELYYPICGRIRRSGDGGRPYVKCNDSGVRVMEAKCAKTLAEWRLENGDRNRDHELLVYNQSLALNLEFTPLVFMQLTKFKCGALCVGMSWSHVLGDPFSALECINTWGKILMNNQHPTILSTIPVITEKSIEVHHSSKQICRSIKMLDPLGDNWKIPNSCKMQKHTFHVSEKLLNKIYSDYESVNPFEAISAVIWKSLAKVRGITSEPRIITLCKKALSGEKQLLGNRNQVIGIVKAPMVNVSETHFVDLAKIMAGNFVDETDLMKKAENEKVDYLVYGANLMFVNLEDLDLYGIQMMGHESVFADLSIRGVGDEGVVLVLPEGSNNSGGRIVSVIVPEDQLQDLRNELKVKYGVF